MTHRRQTDCSPLFTRAGASSTSDSVWARYFRDGCATGISRKPIRLAQKAALRRTSYRGVRSDRASLPGRTVAAPFLSVLSVLSVALAPEAPATKYKDGEQKPEHGQERGEDSQQHQSWKAQPMYPAQNEGYIDHQERNMDGVIQ